MADGFLSGLPAANTCPAYLGMVGKLLTAPAFCLPVSAEEVSAAPVQKQGVVVQNVLHRDAVKDGELVRQLPAGSKALMVTPCWLKIVPEWLNKGAALTKVMRECGIRPEEAAAFGDGENDLGMLKSVTHGYAMGNAFDSVLEQISLHAPGTRRTAWQEQSVNCAAAQTSCRNGEGIVIHCDPNTSLYFRRGQIFGNFYPP